MAKMCSPISFARGLAVVVLRSCSPSNGQLWHIVKVPLVLTVMILCALGFIRTNTLWLAGLPIENYWLDIPAHLGALSIYASMAYALYAWYRAVKQQAIALYRSKSPDDAAGLWVQLFAGSFIALSLSLLAFFSVLPAKIANPGTNLDTLSQVFFCFVVTFSVSALVLVVALLVINVVGWVFNTARYLCAEGSNSR